jgi:protein ImuB
MTRRVLCLWIPNWPVQRLQVRQPALRDRPLVLFADGPRGQAVVVTHDRQAAALGVRPGMPLAEAQSLCLDRCHRSRSHCVEPRFVRRDVDADVDGLKRLAWSCDRFSPLVGLEESPTPESLLLDITGCGPLFGGEDQLARQFQQQVEHGGLRVRIAVADTIGAAWALAHCGTRSETVVHVSGERMRQALRRLPVTALRLSTGLVARLHEFQLRRIDQVLALDRAGLPSRFGEELLRRIDQAFGRVPEQIVPERRPEPIEAIWESDVPLQSAALLEVVVTRLLEDVLERLQRAGAGAERLQVHLQTPDRQTQTLSVDCVRPTTSLPHLLELLRLRWERESFPQGICRARLNVLQAGGLTKAPLTLWPVNDEGSNPELLRLIERLSSRLGADAVLRPLLIADAQPERSFTYEPALFAVETGNRSLPQQGHGEETFPISSLSRLIRPVWLLTAPVRLEVLLAGEAGPPGWFRWEQDDHVIGYWGPERITTGWWRDEYIRRDYYHVQTVRGQRFWIFQELLSGEWFLHALCD